MKKGFTLIELLIVVAIGAVPMIIVAFNKWNTIYDPTNGTISGGDIGRFGGDIQGSPN